MKPRRRWHGGLRYNGWCLTVNHISLIFCGCEIKRASSQESMLNMTNVIGDSVSLCCENDWTYKSLKGNWEKDMIDVDMVWHVHYSAYADLMFNSCAIHWLIFVLVKNISFSANGGSYIRKFHIFCAPINDDLWKENEGQPISHKRCTYRSLLYFLAHILE